MASLIIVAHAPLASALAAVASHAYPDCSAQLKALDVAPDDRPEAVQAALLALLPAGPGAETLILTDVFGASPCNAALAVAEGRAVRVAAGVNVPMLWRTLCYADAGLDELLDRALAGAANGVMPVSVARRQNQSPAATGAAHDQQQHHHQQ